MSNVLKRFVLAVAVGGLLLAGSAKAAPDYTVTCKPAVGSSVPCPYLYVEDDVLFGNTAIFENMTVNDQFNAGTVNATDVQSAHVGSSNGDFTRLQVGDVTTLNIANVTQLNTGGLSVSGNATIDGGLDIGEWITANAAEFGSLSIRSGGAISFWDNPWGGISALSTGTWLRANTFLLSRWNGTGACWVTKSLDGTKSRWHWTDNSGNDQSTTSLGSVPAQCLYTDGTP